MAEKHSSIHAHVPTQMQELLQLASKNPDTILFSGGTFLGSTNRGKNFSYPSDIIYLKNVEDLKKITRSERYLEIGAAASINSILQISKRILPGPLSEALSEIGTPSIRNMATLGGNLCTPHRRMDAVPVLLLMDVRLELRSSSESRWISLSRFYTSEGLPDLKDGEVLTRIRIPLEEWNVYIYKKLGSYPVNLTNYLTFCGLANKQRNILLNFRASFSFGGVDIFRNKDVEAMLNGRKLPITEKGALPVLNSLKESLRSADFVTPFSGARAFQLFKWFLESLNNE